MNIAECGQHVQALPTKDINGATLDETTIEYVTLKNYGRCAVIINVGNIAGTTSVTLKQATAVAGTSEKALGFDYMWKNNIKTAVTSNTFDITGSDDNSIYVIPIKVEQLDAKNGFDCLRVGLTDPSAAALIGCEYVLTDGRFGAAVTAITD